MKQIFTIFMFNVACILCIIPDVNAQQQYYYDFRNTLSENSGQGPTLNVLGTGVFVNEGLTELSCISRPVYGFTQNSGVQFDNTAANNFITRTYSIEMYFQFLNNSGFKRILDFKNQTSDFGLYCTSTELQFYDGVTLSTTAFVANQYVHLVVTRDSVSDEIKLFVDGGLLGSFIDSTDFGVLDGANVLNFFQDDLQFPGEARPGRIALLKIYNNNIDDATVAANYNALKTTSGTLLFSPDVTSACLSGNVFNFTNNSLNAGGLTYNWDFGDGNSAPGNNATHSYIAAGNYTVKLFSDDGAGCLDSVANSVTVYQQPPIDLGLDSSFCIGNSLTLDAGAGFASYLWNDNSANQTLTVNASGVYSAVITDLNGCSATDSITVTVIQPPVVNLGADTTLCFGATLSISAPPGEASYLWSTGESTETITVTSAGIYAVEVANATGCFASDTIEVFINSPISLELGTDTAFCDGNTLTLDAGPGFLNYLWGNSTSQQTIDVTTSGTYFVNVTDNSGCTASDTINVIVNPLPVVDLGPDATFCGGTIYTLDAGVGFVNYLWNDGSQNQTLDITSGGTYSVIITDVNGCAGDDQIVVTATPLINLGPDMVLCDGVVATLDAGPGLSSYQWSDGSFGQTLDVTSSGTYSVTVSDIGGCVNSDEITVTFNPVPVIELGPDVTICAGSSLNIDAGAGFYAYLWSDGSTQQTLNVSAAGTYYVTVSSAPACNAQDSITVFVNSGPVVDLGQDTTLCSGNVLTLDAGAGQSSYLWNDGSVNQTLDLTSSGTYSVVVSDLNGCSGTDSVIVNFEASPLVELGPDQNLCSGNAIVLDAGVDGISYLWSDGSTNELLLVLTSGTYSVTVTNLTGCSTVDSVSITVIPSPVVALGADTTLCLGTQYLLDAGSGFASYLWNNGSQLQTYPVSIAGTYAVTVVDANGCSGTDDINVNYFGTVAIPVISQNGNILQSTPAAGYQWYSVSSGLIVGATSQTYAPGLNGSFYVIITDNNGCQSLPSLSFPFVFDGIPSVSGVSLHIAPNPANQSITVESSGVPSGTMTIQLVDMVGKTVFTIAVNPNEKYSMELSGYAEGIYSIQISGTGFIKTQKLIISR